MLRNLKWRWDVMRWTAKKLWQVWKFTNDMAKEFAHEVRRNG